MESRTLLTAAAPAALGFLEGSVATDCTSPAPLSGITIQLYRSGTSTLVASTTTDAAGHYLFTNVAPGTYLLEEVAPQGMVAGPSNVNSEVNPASVVRNGLIQVTVVDPTKVYVNYGGVIASESVNLNVGIDGITRTNATGPFQDSLGTSAGATNLDNSFVTFCVNDIQTLSYTGGSSYQVIPRPITALTNTTSTISADHAGRIAYLFNHYSNSALTDVSGAGLQLAIWELLYDSGNTPDFSAGAFKVVSPYVGTDPAKVSAAIAQATAYDNESAGKSEMAVFLDAASANPGQTEGLQSVLATESLDFTLHQSACTVTNVSYVIDHTRTVSTLAGNVHKGDCVEAVFTVPAGCTETLSLVSYRSPYGPCDPRFAASETVYRSSTATFGPGVHRLKVAVPADNFQVDFVYGNVITHFSAASGATYQAQGRFISGAIGSKYACARPIVQPTA